MSKRIALFPGSFDPITLGHISVVERALPLFDEIIVALGVNENKKYLFEEEQRLGWLKASFAEHSKVKVISFSRLTVDVCKEYGADFILRGIRNGTDHDYERAIALNNKQMSGVETIFLPADGNLAHLSSTIVREIWKNGADIASFVPKPVKP